MSSGPRKADFSVLIVNEDGDAVPVDATLDVGDIEMGAVEIKDGTSDTRAKVATAAPAADDPGLVTRVAGSVTISDGSGPVTVDGTVEITNDVGNPLPVSGTVTASGPVTDTQLRASAVPVSLASVPSHAVTGPLTDTQLRATAVPVSGTVAVTGPLTDTQLRATAVPVANTEVRPATAVITSVAASTSTGVLKASNTARLGLTVHNDSTANLYLAFAATATTSAFTVKIAAGGYYELPRPVYTGAVSGIWDVANGNARITELTA